MAGSLLISGQAQPREAAGQAGKSTGEHLELSAFILLQLKTQSITLRAPAWEHPGAPLCNVQGCLSPVSYVRVSFWSGDLADLCRKHAGMGDSHPTRHSVLQSGRHDAPGSGNGRGHIFLNENSE